MNDFKRSDPLFSLCGLNCGLCTMKLGGHCPGCGQGNRPCRIARCGMEHHVEYCFRCPEYPCPHYDRAGEYDSIITYLHREQDMTKAKSMGIEAYCAEQAEKGKLLDALLTHYNSGREKTLFCLAVNLLDVGDIQTVLDEGRRLAPELPVKEKARYVSNRLREIAAGRGIVLKLRKKAE